MDHVSVVDDLQTAKAFFADLEGDPPTGYDFGMNSQKQQRQMTWVTAGMIAGLLLGVVVGLVTDIGVALGIGIGIAVGAGLGAAGWLFGKDTADRDKRS